MKAMILAAGLGSRLGAITQHTPKCLVEVGGKPLLQWVIERLHRAGVTEVCINLFHLREQVEDFVARTSLPVSVSFSVESKLLGTGGGLLHARGFFSGQEPFFVHNADVYCELDLHLLWSAHNSDPHRMATIAVLSRATSKALYISSSGLLEGWASPESVLAYSPGPGSQAVNFTGIQVVSPAIFDFMEPGRDTFSIIEPLLKAALAKQSVVAFQADGAAWHDIGTPERLAALRAEVGAKKVL